MTETTSVRSGQRGMTAGKAEVHAHHHGAGHSRLRFFGHFLEMQVAMMVGMCLGAPLGISTIPSVELRAAAWLVAMALPMVAWMSIRGMGLRSSLEMSLAMAAPALIALPLFWVGVLTGRAVIGIEHMSMTPAMLVLMAIRRRDYGW